MLLNNQTGGWTETKIDAVDGRALLGPTQVLLADLSGTGNLDIVTATEFGSTAGYLGNGKGAFTASGVLYPTGTGDSGSVIAISDVNGDGIPDLVVTEASVGTVGIFLGIGNGTFKTPYYFGAGTSPSDILLENLHGQASSCGFPDIVVPDLTGGIMVLLNLTASTCPGL